MIQANELRIGNWVNILGEPNNIGSLQSDFWGVFINKVGKPYFEDISPIPLTPEILEKGGFVSMYGYYILQLGNSYEKGTKIFTIGKERIQISIGKGGENSEWIFLPAPTSVHQLQNLYFALTGTELTITL